MVFELTETEAQYFDEVYEVPEHWAQLTPAFWEAYVLSLGKTQRLIPKDHCAKVAWLRTYGKRI